ncbi:dockerin type I repeat-containing protein [Bdellovibrionota bacterium]
MKNFFYTLALLCLFFTPVKSSAQCYLFDCGDCNLDRSFGVTDALEAAQIAAGIKPLQTYQDKMCDVDGSGRIEILDALILAQKAVGNPTQPFRCFPVTTISNIGSGYISQHHYIPFGDSPRMPPHFGCTDTTEFFEIIPDPGTTQLTVIISGMSIGTDLDLYVGKPGTVPGDIDDTSYFRKIIAGPYNERYDLFCGGLDAQAGSVAVAVHAYQRGMYTLEVYGDTPPCTCNVSGGYINAGTQVTDTIAHSAGPGIPYPCDPNKSKTFELTDIPQGTTSVEFFMQGPPPPDGDFDLWLGWPGVCGGDCYDTNYHGTIPSAWNPGGWGNPFYAESYTIDEEELPAYGSGPIAVGVSVWSSPYQGASFTVDAFTAGSGGPVTASSYGFSPVPGSISLCRGLYYLPHGEDRWEFSVPAGLHIDVSVDTASEGGAFDPIVEVYESGQTVPLFTSNDAFGCTHTPPRLVGVTWGNECPSISFISVPTTTTYEVSVKREPDGFCRDSNNGAYILSVEANSVALQLTPLKDDY